MMSSNFRPFLAVLPLLLCAAGTMAAPQGSLQAHLIAASDTPVLDGELSDAAWRSAPVYDSFHEYEPRNGKRAPDGLRTTVQMLIDNDALVIGVRAWDANATARQGTLTRRDKVSKDQDFIGIWIDPTGHGTAAQFVRVNTHGILSDGVYRADDDESDFGPDFPVDAAVKLLDDGYSVELRWPLSSLRFPYADGKQWRAMIERSIPHADGTLLLSVPLKTDALNYITLLQEIDGMGDTVSTVRDRRFFELKPELTLRQEKEQVDGVRNRSRKAALGLDINVRPRADWVFNATLNPDYSQVEIDEPTSSGAKRIALSLPEKRGFFLESSDVLGLPLAAFYSRTVADPAWGLRATWRASGADATAMSLRDQEGGVVLRGSPYETLEFDQTSHTQASMMRARWHGNGLLLGAFASQRDYGNAGRNAVIGVDGQWRSAGGEARQQAAMLLMHSRTSASFDPETGPAMAPAKDGAYLWGKFTYRSSSWMNELAVEAIGPHFINDNGFVPQTGILKTTVDINRVFGPRQVDFLGLELYDHEAHLGLQEIRTLSNSASGQPGGQIIERKFQPGFWMFAPRQTRFWANLGFDQLRGHREGKLHNTPALHFGVESSPFPWLVNLAAEFTLGRQLDIAADRVGPGGNAQVDIGLRFPLPRGVAIELDHRWNRAWVRGTLGHAAFADNGWRWLGMLHFGPRDSLRLLAQDTWAARRDDGVSALDPWSERQLHRSLLYRHLWRHGRSMSAGLVKDKARAPASGNTALTVKFQWEV